MKMAAEQILMSDKAQIERFEQTLIFMIIFQ
jgi:hypothetical protein